MTAYLDTSAAAKLLIVESGTIELAAYLDALDDDPVSSALLETELRRVAVRVDAGQDQVSALLARVTLIEPDRALFHEAGLLPGHALRNLDALHLATALRCEDPVVVGYDRRMLESATSLGMTVHSP